MSWSCGNSCSVNVPDGPALTWKDSAAKAVILTARIFGTSKLVPFHERLGKRRGITIQWGPSAAFCERARLQSCRYNTPLFTLGASAPDESLPILKEDTRHGPELPGARQLTGRESAGPAKQSARPAFENRTLDPPM